MMKYYKLICMYVIKGVRSKNNNKEDSCFAISAVKTTTQRMMMVMQYNQDLHTNNNKRMFAYRTHSLHIKNIHGIRTLLYISIPCFNYQYWIF